MAKNSNSQAPTPKQVKSKKRVKDHGEVFTNEREVKSMLDMVKDESERIDSRVLKPARGGKIAGSGRKKKESGSTVRVRIPERYLSEVTKFIDKLKERDGFKD